MSNRIICAVIVMHDNNNASVKNSNRYDDDTLTSSDDNTTKNTSGDGEWKPYGVYPNAVAGFMDLHWEQGFTNHFKYFEETHSTVFLLDFELKPRSFSVLQKLVMKNASHLSLCNSLKLHFFYQNKLQMQKGEFSDDFLYSSAVPLEPLIGGHRVYAGVFNYNMNEIQCDPIPNISICVCPMRPISIPRNTLLLVNQGPDMIHHKRLLRLTDWIMNAVSSFVPPGSNEGTQFAQMQTFGRDYGTMLLFQDLHKLFDPQVETLGHVLPPALAVYALCNALIINECTVDHFIENLSADCFKDKKLAILSDTVACFRLCAHEGIYWPDMSCKKSVEDQPFPDACLIPNQTRIFKRDDCEGRTSQVFMMINLFRAMGVAYTQNPRANFKIMYDKVSQKNHRVPLRLEETTLHKLLIACIALGIMLRQNDATDAELCTRKNRIIINDDDEDDDIIRGLPTATLMSKITGGKRLQVHTIVGDVSFPTAPQTTTGHSFSIAMDPDDDKTHYIIETTAWGHVSQLKKTKTEKVRSKHIDQALVNALYPLQKNRLPEGIRSLLRCAFVSPQKENKIYHKIDMSHDYIYFTRSTPTAIPLMGARLSDIHQNGIYTFKTPTTTTRMNVDTKVFRMRTRRFIQELCASPQRTTRLWAPVSGAEAMLKEYDEIQKIIPGMRRAVCPPPRSEEAILDIMSGWGIIKEKHTQTLLPNQHRVLFSIPRVMPETDHNIQNAIQNLAADESLSLLSVHPFMNSQIFRGLM